MTNLQLAIVLIIMVSCVIVATRPVQPRRRSTPAAARPRASFAKRSPATAATPAVTGSHRNRWDRADILRAVGRDFADPDAGLTAWPAPGAAAPARWA